MFAEPVRDVLVQHADHVYLYDYGPMLAEHRARDADATIGVQRIERRFVHLFGMVDADVWQHDISRDVLPSMLAQGFSVHAFEVHGYWADIGTVERYHLGHMALLDDPELLPAGLRPITLESAAPLQADGTSLRTARSIVAGEVRSAFCHAGSVIEEGATVIRSVLMPGARVRPAGTCEILSSWRTRFCPGAGSA